MLRPWGLILLAAAGAPPSPVQKAFTSTIVSTYPAGRTAGCG